MALVKITDLNTTLEDTRATLLSAADGDGIVSREDLKRLLQETDNPNKRRFLEFFYGFLLQMENRPRMRVTEAVIDRGIAFIQQDIIPNFEIKERLSLSTSQEIAQLNESAFPMAMELIRTTVNEVILSPQEVHDRISQLTEGLLFDDYGSEAAIAIEPFFLAHPTQALSPISFTDALGVDPQTPKGRVARFESAERVLLTFVEQHLRSGLSDRARTLVELMEANLNDPKIIILGEDNHPDLESNHPVYVVGIGKMGDLAGFTSTVIWT